MSLSAGELRAFVQQLRLCSLARPEEFGRAIDDRLRQEPDCAVARYLSGCREFDRGCAARGVREMMIAQHIDAGLESAALLVFSGLAVVSRGNVPLLAVLLDTWDEFRRPVFDRTRSERALFDLFAEPAEFSFGSSSLAGRLWRLPIRTLRTQIREAVGSQGGSYSLLSAAV